MPQIVLSKPVIGSKFLDWFPIVIPAGYLLISWQPWEYLSTETSLILIVNFFIVASLLWWADGYEREPVRTIVWSILWGVFTAIFITSLITPGTSSLYVAAIVEEASKLLGLFWIFRRGSIHTATDALVLGGYIGLGFTIFEDFAYSAGDFQAVEILISRGIFSVFAHTLFSGIGAAIMYLLWQKLESGGVVLGFICSYVIHFVWNLSLTFDLFSISQIMYFVIYAILPPVSMIITCVLVRRKEVRHIQVRGKAALLSEIILQEDLDQLINPKLRRQHSKSLKTISQKIKYRKALTIKARKVLEFNKF